MRLPPVRDGSGFFSPPLPGQGRGGGNTPTRTFPKAIANRATLARMRRFPFLPPLFRGTFLILTIAALGLRGPATRAADPQPYTVAIEKTGNAPLDQALNDSSTLVSLRENAPVGPFALIVRAQQDTGRFETALHSFGYYKGAVSLTIAGHAVDDPNLPDLLNRAPANPPVEVHRYGHSRPSVPSAQGRDRGRGPGVGSSEARPCAGRPRRRLGCARRSRPAAKRAPQRGIRARQGGRTCCNPRAERRTRWT